MLEAKSPYQEMIEARATRAAALAAEYGFGAEIKGSLLEVFNEHASASVLLRSDHIVLEQLNVDVHQRRRNHGSRVLEAVVAIANQAELPLELIAEPPMHPNEADLSQSELQAWYRRHGFLDAGDILMSRLPERVNHKAATAAVPLPSPPFRSHRNDRFLQYAQSRLTYSEAAGAAFYGLVLSFFCDWYYLGVAAVDRLNRPYTRI